jgi:uncharacterized Fe-S cluster-containing radical SAM superfamily protein
MSAGEIIIVKSSLTKSSMGTVLSDRHCNGILVLMNNKLIVVAGGAGKLGRLLVNALLDHPGVRVRVLVRDPKKPAHVVSFHRITPTTSSHFPKAST